MDERVIQRQEILNHIENYGSITNLEATKKYGILSFPKRISELRRLGYDIEDEWITVKSPKGINGKKRVKRYFLGGTSE